MCVRSVSMYVYTVLWLYKPMNCVSAALTRCRPSYHMVLIEIVSENESEAISQKQQSANTSIPAQQGAKNISGAHKMLVQSHKP